MIKFRYRIKSKLLLSVLLSAAAFTGCSLQKMAVKASGGIIENTIEALYAEPDYDLAKEAMPSLLLQLEGLLLSDPGNSGLIINAVKGYTGYALGFIEDEDPDKAGSFYLRARDHGMGLLSSRSSISKNYQGSIEEFESAVMRLNERDLPLIFWTANAWAGYINLNRTNTDALADQAYVDALMQKVLDLDETYFHGSAHMYFGIVYGERGMAGGDLEKSREHFEKCFRITNNNFLLSYVMYAKYYAINAFDEAVFVEALNRVLNTPSDVLPGIQLLNEIAKKKAEILLRNKDEYFF
ncbi:TRAP transporter TatT component family protein [candidate division KSB1 bacterium]